MALLLRAQRRHDVGPGRVAGDVEAADPFDRDDLAVL